MSDLEQVTCDKCGKVFTRIADGPKTIRWAEVCIECQKLYEEEVREVSVKHTSNKIFGK